MEDNSDNESEHKRSKDRSPSPAVKSTAVVKYTAYQSPVGYARLQCNTDLNLPPSNWGAPIDSYGMKEILTRGTGLSSFRMAHMFPDCVGEVDVISGAECIKKLLKLPYQPTGTVSMMVHRIENTLLLDDFDVYEYLMKSEWSWLKDFFYENILKTMSEQERMSMVISPLAGSSLQLTQQFLHHSVTRAPVTPVTPVSPITPVTQPLLPVSTCLAGPYLPEPRSEEQPNEHLYNRNVLWTFEDIQMLIGSDLPIFGDKDRPCVSLRLRDAKDPINVLTGIDYWLDNLMCNVPEVLMCYHLDGIVQKYEPMKTEDLPNMENSRFSPKVVRNVAQNILSFLKSNVTKAGHTYWLFKGPHDDVVKLYDLTSLCPDNMDNPFTTPVAMLLYRVARNMRLTNRSKHVKQLLEHVLELLKEERYPQIVASSHYMLADLYVPATTNPAQPDFKDEYSDSEDDMDFESCEQDDATTSNVPEDDSSTNIDEASAEKDEKSSKDLKVEKRGKGTKGDQKGKKVGEKGLKGGEKDSSEENSLAVQIRGLTLRKGDSHRKAGTPRKRKSRTGGAPPTTGPDARPADARPPDARSPPGVAPQRCGRALHHALTGLRALAHVTIHKDKEEERERLKQQIIREEQHPKMANPYEPIQMIYEPITKQESKDHKSRSRRRKHRKNSEKSANHLIETNENIDKNAILVRKENKPFPSLHEPNRDDNFAWKLHLKTLLYEKICLAYATLAEYSYSYDQYGFSLKYIDMASKCQKLLSNMIIKSRVVDPSCLIGRAGDNYFQISKNWNAIEKFKKQFEMDHETDTRIRQEIENDMAEETQGVQADDFDLEVGLPSCPVTAMLKSCEYYRRAESVGSGPISKRAELRRRLASVTNELALLYMNDAQQIYMTYIEEEDSKSAKAKHLYKQFTSLSKKSQECLDDATEIFRQVDDVPNLALLLCNKGRYMRFKAHCQHGDFTSEKRVLYARAEELYLQALELLEPTSSRGASVGELVTWELSCHLYNKATLMQDMGQVHEVSEVADAFKHALKYCLQSPGTRQYLYQFRAAMIYHRLGSLYHSQYRLTTEDGPKRRILLSATTANYSQAANMFAALEDSCMFLTAQLEHVAVQEAQAIVSPNLKLKSLQTAVQLLRQCYSIMKLIKDRDPDDQKEQSKPEDGVGQSMKTEYSLITLYEHRLNFILKNIIQYCRSKSNKDYEKMTDMYKKLYCASLKIKKYDDVRLYAASICEVLESMEVITKEFE